MTIDHDYFNQQRRLIEKKWKEVTAYEEELACTLRDEFAMEVMKIQLHLHEKNGLAYVFCAEDCYDVADQMMAAREEKEDKNEIHG